MPTPLAPPDTVLLRVIGRVGGGAPDEKGQRAPGGVCFYQNGSEVRLAPGDVAEVPTRAAAGLLADGLAVLHGEPDPTPAPEPESDDTDLPEADDDLGDKE